MTRRHLLVALVAVLFLPATGATATSAVTPNQREEFFMISSVDAVRGRIVLKRPTEVTLLMQVNGQTVYRDEQDRPLRLVDLRTGDTVYIVYRQDSYRPDSAAATALRVRLGAMTVQELQRRYR